MHDFDRFGRDISGHVLTVLVDDGVRRHLRCARPQTYCMSFDVLTWPGHLCYTGDMGCFVFSRLPDMFEFFRGKEDGRIDFRYWAEKCLASDKTDGLLEYNVDRFRRVVKEGYESFVEQHALSSDEAAGLWREVEDDVLSRGENSHEAREAAMHFRWALGRVVFPDFWEHRLEEYTSRFVWCCYALRWAIARYDETPVLADLQTTEKVAAGFPASE